MSLSASMAKLSAILQSLRLENGEPDLEARRWELDNLVRYLSIQEIRRIRVQLGSIPICNDICDEFPLEIITYIAAQLSLEDFLKLRRVSRKWRDTFASDDISRAMIKRHFRTHWEQDYQGLRADANPKTVESPKDWFQRAASQRLRRKNGHYCSMSIYWHNVSEGQSGLEPDPFYEYQYCNGRVAIRFNSTVIQVKGLRCDSREDRFMDENREPIEKWLLSDKYLIGLKSSPTTLLAWPLNSGCEGQPQYVRLPSRILNFTASQDQVAVVTSAQEILFWRVGGSLTSLDLTKAKEDLTNLVIKQAVVLFHQVKNRFSVAYKVSLDGDMIYVIHQYLNQVWQCSHSTPSLVPNNHLPITIFKSLDDGAIGIFERNDRPGHPDQHHDSFYTKFDTYSNCFEKLIYSVPTFVRNISVNWNGMVDRLHFWQDQILLPTYGRVGGQRHYWGLRQRYMPEGNEDALLVSLHGWGAHLRGPYPRQIPWHGAGGSSSREIHFVQEDQGRQNESRVAYFLIGGQQFAKDARPASTGQGSEVDFSRHVMGDDDFVVLCGPFGFVVWCFDESVVLSTENAWVEGSELAGKWHPLGPAP